MRQRGHGTRFGQEAALEIVLLLIGNEEGQTHHLEGDRPAEHRIAGKVNHTHGSSTDLRLDVVTADPGRRWVGPAHEIQSEIGRGTMGVVYRAHDPLLRRVIALKTILIPTGISPEDVQEFEERFFQEARAAARLSHHAIVLVHDIGRDAETRTLFMALEFLSGQTIAEMTAGGKALEWREAVRIAEVVAEALYHASLVGVVHRDIKPANIMVLPSGEPKIMDFGIAKVETARLKLTGVGDSLGTPLYMSPEQAMGQEADHRSDLFSLGATLYRMLTGLDAFAASNIPGIIKRVLDDALEPPSRMRSGVPTRLDAVLARGLAKERVDRYADAKALADDLRDVLNDRSPRHAAGGVRTEVGSGTQAGDALELSDAGAFDPMEAMAALVPDAPQPGPPAGAMREALLSSAVSEPARPQVSPVPQRTAPPADTHGSRVPWQWIAAVAAYPPSGRDSSLASYRAHTGEPGRLIEYDELALRRRTRLSLQGLHDQGCRGGVARS